jgi:hypothetical protein
LPWRKPHDCGGAAVTTYERAAEGYDEAHEEALVAAITKAIGEASMVTDPPCLVLRTGELVSALTSVLATALALSPERVRSPTAIRKTLDKVRQRLIRRVAVARANAELRDLEARIFRGDDRERGGNA